MRSLLAIAALLIAAGTAQADRRVFIVSSHSDGYGVDRCLANGQSCGTAAATAFCKAREYQQATSFQQVDKDEITGAVPTAAQETCRGGACDRYVAIVCSR